MPDNNRGLSLSLFVDFSLVVVVAAVVVVHSCEKVVPNADFTIMIMYQFLFLFKVLFSVNLKAKFSLTCLSFSTSLFPSISLSFCLLGGVANGGFCGRNRLFVEAL